MPFFNSHMLWLKCTNCPVMWTITLRVAEDSLNKIIPATWQPQLKRHLCWPVFLHPAESMHVCLFAPDWIKHDDWCCCGYVFSVSIHEHGHNKTSRTCLCSLLLLMEERRLHIMTSDDFGCAYFVFFTEDLCHSGIQSIHSSSQNTVSTFF